ncbi:prostaglandin F2-alpha receptor isoform X1 [Pelobates cultripes]|uniref:Prostaglandin F2-alpha receptor n=1 Tax=Pelobates cultripes TaxID=61616 RepID=A0AAD1SV99_PELCU|nr:prostaglandin F2-alpha receptor isoform X1 [Pelobates cultripes]
MNNSSETIVFGSHEAPSNTTYLMEQKISVFFSIVFMTVGIISNGVAFIILMKAYQRFRKKSKASFLLFASGLVVTDLFGHLINGTIAVFVYAFNRDWMRFDRSNILCSIFGMCMVFFGLCPLLLGCVMAVERCIGVTKPIFHSTKMTSKHAKIILSLVWLFAIFVALLPILTLRDYHIQGSRTWCFLKTEQVENWMDQFNLLFFSSLGLLSLAISFLCNAMTGLTLLRSKMKNQQYRQGRSHHIEMIVQLLAIMCVCCICWAPFLITMANIGLNGDSLESRKTILFSLRMATWNQILDPWVYILLRKTILKKLFRITRRCCGVEMIRIHTWEFSSFKNSLKVATISDSSGCTRTNTLNNSRKVSTNQKSELTENKQSFILSEI